MAVSAITLRGGHGFQMRGIGSAVVAFGLECVAEGGERLAQTVSVLRWRSSPSM